MHYNPELMSLAEWRLNELSKLEKQAFVPPGAGDPSQGGGGDPSQGGGAPPGGMPPDPSQGGAGPTQPMDPSAMGGAPPVPGGGGMTADTISQIVSQTVQQMSGAGAAGAGGGAGAGKLAKASLETVAIDIFQVKKMLQHLFNTMGIPMPPDIIDGPNRDPQTGLPMPPGMPGSTSDPTTQPAQGAAPGGQPPQQGGSIPPIQPIEPAGPTGAAPSGGGEKQSDDQTFHMGNAHSQSGFDVSNISKAAALFAICKRISDK